MRPRSIIHGYNWQFYGFRGADTVWVWGYTHEHAWCEAMLATNLLSYSFILMRKCEHMWRATRRFHSGDFSEGREKKIWDSTRFIFLLPVLPRDDVKVKFNRLDSAHLLCNYTKCENSVPATPIAYLRWNSYLTWSECTDLNICHLNEQVYRTLNWQYLK